jgi:glycine/D-amino acid oxidase-like deaminating enzyme
VLEADHVGYGASGRNGGFVEATLTHGLHNGRAHLPDESDALLRLGRENMAGLMDFARAHRIDYHLEQPGSITVATAAWHLDDLAETADLHRDAGDTVTQLDADAVRAEVDSPTYLGGLYERDTALVHPGKLARGLARQFRATFAQLRDVRFDRWWGGAIATTTRFTATFGEALGGRVVYAGLGVARGRCAGPACSSRGVRSRARTAGRAGAGHGCGCGCGCSTVSGSVRLGGRSA